MNCVCIRGIERAWPRLNQQKKCTRKEKQESFLLRVAPVLLRLDKLAKPLLVPLELGQLQLDALQDGRHGRPQVVELGDRPSAYGHVSQRERGDARLLIIISLGPGITKKKKNSPQ